MAINDDLIENYINNFFGYGNIHSNYWFVGLEEGGGKDKHELINRIQTWKKRGQMRLEDCRDFHLQFGEKKWHRSNPYPQKTWSVYIRLFLKITNQDADILNFQKNKFCRKDSDQCCIELRPIPQKNTATKEWPSKGISGLNFLSTQENYYDYCLKTLNERRLNFIRKQVQDKNPKYVFFFGKEWGKHLPLQKWEKLSYGYKKKWKSSNFFILKHPQFMTYSDHSDFQKEKKTNDYYDRVANDIVGEI